LAFAAVLGGKAMNTTLFSSGDNEFDILDLKARFAFKTETSISFDIGRWSNSLRLPINDGEEEETVWSADRPFVFNVVGWLDVHHPCNGPIKTQVRIQIPVEYHSFDRMKPMVETIFKALDIPLDETYESTVLHSDKSTGIHQPTDRNGAAAYIF
jgi:hypothetical protein